ncbi:lactonase family protein [Candidatus Bathyarchaeota archaeon]|nr:lactonase family protein [Candidatus Bathyarchaeota archaeon]
MGEEAFVYIGTYSRGMSEGIYIYRMDLSNGSMKPLGTAGGVINPSYLVIDPQGPNLYAVNEVRDFLGKPGGGVTAFSIDPETGSLRFLNHQVSGGAHPCYISMDYRGRFLLVANYSGGSVSVIARREDGGLGELTDFVQHKGSSVNPKRQEGPHPHSILLDPSNLYAFVPDLGLDKILIYRFDSDRGKLQPSDEPWVSVRPGAGPRHFTFHPNGRFAYLINELDNTIIAFTYEATTGRLKELQTVNALPEDFLGKSYCADIHVTPSGKFLYGSNRGHDSIVAFKIDKDTGKLAYIAHEPTGGRTPRNFAIDPTGRYLLVGNQDTDTVQSFSIDDGSGRLEPTGYLAEVPAPACLKIIPTSCLQKT